MSDYPHNGSTNGRMRRQRVKRNRRRLLLCIILLTVCVIGIHKLITKNVEETQTVVSPVYLADQDEVEATDKAGSTPNQEAEDTSKEEVTSALNNEHLVEDVSFVEKYLYQQTKGEMPDGANGEKIAYLSFDDGPSETVTPIILDILKKEEVQATFFVLGSNIDKSEKSKEILKRIVEEGHAIGNHTYSHKYNLLYPNKKIDVEHFMSEIEQTNESLKKVLGDNFKTRGIRFPGGHMTWKQSDPDGMALLDKKLNAEGYHQVDWNVLPKDAEGAPKKAQQLVAEFKKTVKGREKAVILMHDTYGKEETAKALPEMIAYLKEHGYTFKIMK